MYPDPCLATICKSVYYLAWRNILLLLHTLEQTHVSIKSIVSRWTFVNLYDFNRYCAMELLVYGIVSAPNYAN